MSEQSDLVPTLPRLSRVTGIGTSLAPIGDKSIESVAEFRDTMESVDVERGIRLQITRAGVRSFVFIRSAR